MLLATTSIGDMLLTLSAITSLKKNDLGGFDTKYRLAYTDLPTGNGATHEYESEDEAVRAFCAFVSSDAPDLSKDLAALHDTDLGQFTA